MQCIAGIAGWGPIRFGRGKHRGTPERCCLYGEEVYRLLQAWEHVQEVASLITTHPGGRAVVEIPELLWQLYCTYQHGPAPHCRGPASRV